MLSNTTYFSDNESHDSRGACFLTHLWASPCIFIFSVTLLTTSSLESTSKMPSQASATNWSWGVICSARKRTTTKNKNKHGTMWWTNCAEKINHFYYMFRYLVSLCPAGTQNTTQILTLCIHLMAALRYGTDKKTPTTSNSYTNYNSPRTTPPMD